MKALSQVLPLKNSTIVRVESWIASEGIPLTIRSLGTVSPELAARMTERIFLNPPRHPVPQTEAAFLATGHRFDIDHHGTRLAAWSWDGGASRGAGPTVFLLHGWGGRAGQFHAWARSLVDAGFSVVAFDAPAHGQSPGRESSVVDFGRALFSAVSAAGPAHALIGHSAGGAAIAWALSRGLRAGRAVLIGAPTHPGTWAEELARRYGIQREVMDRMRARIERRYEMSWDEISVAHICRGIEAPALIVHDRGDKEVPCEEGASIASSWPGARLHLTEGLGHRKILRSPEVVREVIKFIQENRK